jgi:hypothetical protein
MEKCAATIIRLPKCSDLGPSTSAEDCTAHQDSPPSQSRASPRASAHLVEAKEKADNG